jgi:hypothetical protein
MPNFKIPFQHSPGMPVKNPQSGWKSSVFAKEGKYDGSVAFFISHMHHVFFNNLNATIEEDNLIPLSHSFIYKSVL